MKNERTNISKDPKPANSYPVYTEQRPDFSEDYGDNFTEDEAYSKQQRKTKEPREKKQRRKKGRASTVIKIILIIILLLLLFFGIYTALVVSRINYSDDHADSESIISEVGELKSADGVVNILVFGTDNHSEDEYGRSDSIIMLSIDYNHRMLKQTSFLRDLYVTIPGYGRDKLNAAFSYGGAKLATETIEYNFGIAVDSYCILDYSGFTSIIDAMNGIELELTKEEIRYINWQSYRNHQTDTKTELDPDSYEYTEDENGSYTAKVRLCGRQALWYARDRDSAGSDFDRTSRQRTVMDTVFSQLKHSDPFTMLRVIYEAAPMITTDMSRLDTLRTALRTPLLLAYGRKEHRVPQSDNYYNDTSDSGAQILVISDTDREKQELYSFVFDYDGN